MPLSSFGRLTLLGKGSYGKVYRAVRADDSVEYAIKELNIAHMNKREREESANEVRLLASISHPNIIRYYEAFVELDHLYIVTELAATDLNTLIEQKKRTGARLSEDTIWSYFIQMCIGLKYLHDSNVMHRDLKPQNVFITKSHAIKIGDLGCSKLMKSAHAQTQCGTPYYMSPELWKNQGYGKPSDVWALGCVLYHMATLTTPFDATDLKGLARKVVHTKSPKIRSAYRYSADLTSLAAKLLAKEPNQRPSVGAILASAAVQKRMGLVDQLLAPAQPHARGNGEGAAEAMNDGKAPPTFSLHKTIVVPSNIGNLKYQLPASRYNTPPATAGGGGGAAAAVNSSVSARSASDPMRRLQAAQSSQAMGGAGGGGAHHYPQPHAPVPVASSAPATPAPANGALQRVNPNVPPSSRRGQQAMSQDNPMVNKPYPALKPSHAQQQQQQQQHQYYDGDKENAGGGGGGGGFLPKVRASAQQMAAAAAAAQLGQNVRPARQWDVSDAGGDRLAELPQFASRAAGGAGGQQTGSASVLNAQSRYASGNGYGAAVGGALKHHQHQQQQALQSQYQQSQQSQGSSYAQHPYSGAYAPAHAHGQSSLAPLLGGGGGGAGPTPKSTYALQHSPASALAQRQRAAAHGLGDATDPYSGRGSEYGRKPGALPALGTRPW